jgi:hypothetical protein
MSDSDKEDKNIKALRAAIDGIQKLERKLQTTKLLFDWFLNNSSSLESSQKMGYAEVTETFEVVDKFNPIIDKMLEGLQGNEPNVDVADALLQLKDDRAYEEDKSPGKATSDTDEDDEVTKKRKKASKARQERRVKQKMKSLAEKEAKRIALEQKESFTVSGTFVNSFDIESYIGKLSEARGNEEKEKVYTKMIKSVGKSVFVHRTFSKFGVNKRNKEIESMKPEPLEEWSIELHVRDPELPAEGDATIFPWFSVKQSTIKDAGLGLFAARKFSKDECIGIYMGKTVGKQNKSVYAMAASFGVCDPGRGFKSSMPRAYHGMGIHICNDPSWSKEKVRGQNTNKNKSKSCNIFVSTDMLVHAIKDILPNQEILLDYNYNNKEEEEEKQATEVSSKRKRSSQRIKKRVYKV